MEDSKPRISSITNREKMINWTELHPDQLHIIAKKLLDIYSFIRFRAVCKKWRAAVSISDHPPLLPWLLDNKSLLNMHLPDRHFYSIQHDKAHIIQMPQAINKYLVGPSRGFMLLLERDRNGEFLPPLLVNPFTNVQIDLPFINGDFDLFIKPISLGPNPLDENGEAVIYMCGTGGRPTRQAFQFVAVCQPDRNRWSPVIVPNVKTLTYCNGRLFTVDCMARMTIVVDVETSGVVAKIPPPENFIKIDYLVEAFGELLGVTRGFESYEESLSVEDCRFSIYRLEEVTEANWHWVKLSEIGDLMLFLDEDNGFAMRASGIEGARRNCIYFMRSNGYLHPLYMKYVVARYDMADGRAEVVPRPTESPATWVTPALY